MPLIPRASKNDDDPILEIIIRNREESSRAHHKISPGSPNITREIRFWKGLLDPFPFIFS